MRKLLLVAALTASTLGAQTRSVVRVHVLDSARAAVADANVSVVKGLNETLASATTDATGRRVLAFEPGDVEVLVRKIGFARASRFVHTRPGDTTAVEITLARSPQTLGAVNVVGREDLKRKSYAIDAEEIAASKRPLVDGRDIVKKLRPDIISSRGGSKVCPPALRIWVNGVRLRLVRPSDALVAGKRMSIHAAQNTPHMAASGIDALPLIVGQVLSEIKAEHIAEMTYRDCMDFTVNRASATSSIFIALKPGIAYQPGVGSFVSDAGVIQDEGPERPDSLLFGSATFPSFRYRVLGVFDLATGDPLEGVAVVDSATNTRALTTVTGTVTLVFLPEGASTIRIEKPGYVDLLHRVSISPSDTIPITLTLERKKP